jgi:hypothetical protein
MPCKERDKMYTSAYLTVFIIISGGIPTLSGMSMIIEEEKKKEK